MRGGQFHEMGAPRRVISSKIREEIVPYFALVFFVRAAARLLTPARAGDDYASRLHLRGPSGSNTQHI